MAFEVFYSPEAVDHLQMLTKAEQVLVVDEVEQQLSQQPKIDNTKKKTAASESNCAVAVEDW